MDQVTVIRIIKYEGTEAAVRAAIAKSMPEGIRNCAGYDLTISTHSSDLTPVDQLPDEEVQEVLSQAKPWSEPTDMDQLGPFGRYLEQMRSSPIPADTRPANCSCPPKGHKGVWAAGPCPVHQGLRRKLHNANEASVRFTFCNCNIPGYEELPCPRHPGKL